MYGGKNYPTCLERISLIQKKLVRIITCSPFRAHTEPLYFANKILKVCDINDYIVGTCMYECLYRWRTWMYCAVFSRRPFMLVYAGLRLFTINNQRQLPGFGTWGCHWPGPWTPKRSRRLFCSILSNALSKSRSMQLICLPWSIDQAISSIGRISGVSQDCHGESYTGSLWESGVCRGTT